MAIDIGVAGYAFYLVRIASFSTIYGPLGAVLAFLALLYFARDAGAVRGGARDGDVAGAEARAVEERV